MEVILAEVILALGILIVGLLFVLRILLGQHVFNGFIAHWVFEISKVLVTFPFKLLKFILRK